jgi:hypothetical protein
MSARADDAVLSAIFFFLLLSSRQNGGLHVYFSNVAPFQRRLVAD